MLQNNWSATNRNRIVERQAWVWSSMLGAGCDRKGGEGGGWSFKFSSLHSDDIPASSGLERWAGSRVAMGFLIAGQCWGLRGGVGWATWTRASWYVGTCAENSPRAWIVSFSSIVSIIYRWLNFHCFTYRCKAFVPLESEIYFHNRHHNRWS